MAKLYFKYGCMNSGKTTQLIQTAHNYEANLHKVLLLKPKVDTKGWDKVSSRVWLERKVDNFIDKSTNIYNLVQEKQKEYQEEIGVVLIDEVQFCDKEHIKQALKVAAKLDIPVICFGLRTNFKWEPFDASALLLSIADKIEEVKTICSCWCKCDKKANFNVRMVDGKVSFDWDEIVIDGSDQKIEYTSVCSPCFVKSKEWEHSVN